jgi:hypothetical protein
MTAGESGRPSLQFRLDLILLVHAAPERTWTLNHRVQTCKASSSNSFAFPVFLLGASCQCVGLIRRRCLDCFKQQSPTG